MHIEHYTEEHASNHSCCGNTISIMNSECGSVALLIQHAKHTHCMAIVICPALPYFSTLPHKVKIFRQKLLNTKCALFLYNFV